MLNEGISVELIDVQSLIPFDLRKEISKSIAKTNRILIVDEDVPGGASSYILQQLLENQKIFNLLDSHLNCYQQNLTDLHTVVMEIIFPNPQKMIFLGLYMKL